MASDSAKQVAREVMRSLGKTRINKGKILRKNGYAESVVRTPQFVTETESYQSEIRPLVVRLEEERNEIVERLKVTRNKAKYRDLIDGLDKITKNIQLLTGGRTEDLHISWEK